MYVIAGCNGAGKTTVANSLLPDYLNCNEFVNADILAERMDDRVGINAGKRTLELVRRSIQQGIDFAIETTLSGLSHRRMITFAREYDYEIILIYAWIDSVEVSSQRVQERVELGGHYIPTQDIRRRYKRGLVHLFNTYIWLVDYWIIIDNTTHPRQIVAEGQTGNKFSVLDSKRWIRIKSKYNEFKAEL